MKKQHELVKCEQRKFDCFACIDEKCIALKDTHFNGKSCPFYKKKNMTNDSRK